MRQKFYLLILLGFFLAGNGNVFGQDSATVSSKSAVGHSSETAIFSGADLSWLYNLPFILHGTPGHKLFPITIVARLPDGVNPGVYLTIGRYGVSFILFDH